MSEDQHDVTYPGGLTRLFVDASLAPGAAPVLDEAQSHYLQHVLRAGTGGIVRLFNGRDGEWSARITAVARRSVSLLVERQVAPQAGVPDLWLLVAPVKKAPFDFIVQKATELGVARIQPVITRRTIVERVNTARMRANVIEAAEQSGRLCIPGIGEPVALPKLLAAWPEGRRLMFCDEGGAAPSATAALAGAPRGPWAILTGPEGGFDPDERTLLRTQNFMTPVSLGPRIMRADTAALAALALWQFSLGDCA